MRKEIDSPDFIIRIRVAVSAGHVGAAFHLERTDEQMESLQWMN